jgi:hypothetical protein
MFLLSRLSWQIALRIKVTRLYISDAKYLQACASQQVYQNP